jgi:hypothetical protein
MNNNSNYWEDLYKSKDVKTLPWYLKELDPDLSQSPSKRKIYLKEIIKKLVSNGLLFLKCFTGKKQSIGPYRISKKVLENIFSKDFYIEKIKDTFFQKNKTSFSQALFVVMKKR